MISSESPQLFEKAPLLIAQVSRQNDLNTGEEVASARAAKVRHALSRQAEEPSVLRLGRYAESDFAIERWDFDFTPQNGGNKGYRHLDAEVVLCSFELLVGQYLDEQVQVAFGASVRARLSLARDPYSRAGSYSRRDFDFKALQSGLDPLASAETAGPPADYAAPAARGAHFLNLHLQSARGSGKGFFQSDFDFMLGVAAGLWGARPAELPAPAAPEQVFKEAAHIPGIADVAELAVGVSITETARAAPAGPRLGLGFLDLFGVLPLVAVLIVLAPLLGVGENFVRLVDFLEAGFGRLVTRIDVRVVLTGQPAVRLFDVFVSSVPA
jgi:hypothetical protein